GEGWHRTLAPVMETANGERVETSTVEGAGTFHESEPSVAPAGDIFRAGVSIDQAAASLQVSSSTVRRWVKEGRLHSERVATPQGHAFRVYLDRGLKGVEPSVAPSDRPAPAGSTTAAV